MPKRKFTDRSRGEDRDRCRRLRYWGYESGPSGRGIVPVKKSIHLVLGGAVHAGLEVLLREGQEWLNQPSNDIEFMFGPVGMLTAAKFIEDGAVDAALDSLQEMMGTAGVELDVLEQQGSQQAQGAVIAKQDAAVADRLSDAALGLEAPIVIDFGDAALQYGYETPSGYDLTAADFANAGVPATVDELDKLNLSPEMAALLSTDITLDQSDGMDKYLREELAALVEAMVRAYARRRWRPLMEGYEILEVEREGWWKLGEWGSDSDICQCGHPEIEHDDKLIWDDGQSCCMYCHDCKKFVCSDFTELYFMSRHDGLLRDRQTSALYLLSYKTTGSWDRRKEMDAEVDQQGLSEAVDVEKRMAEAWHLLYDSKVVIKARSVGITEITAPTSFDEALSKFAQVEKLVNDRVARWLQTLPEPPRILGVRYEYLLKGARRQDKKDAELPGRYVADTPLVRAWKQDGITADDRRWAWTYDWYGLEGKDGSKHTLSYRSWQKSPVWKFMPIAQWIDMLDRGDVVQPDAYDENGVAMDCLGEQFRPPVTVYRNEDSYRDWMESTEATEVEVAQRAEEVRRARAEGGEAAERSALNRLFPKNLRACIFPGVCPAYPLCHGPESIRRDPLGSGLFVIRQPNHPVELTDDKEEL